MINPRLQLACMVAIRQNLPETASKSERLSYITRESSKLGVLESEIDQWTKSSLVNLMGLGVFYDFQRY